MREAWSFGESALPLVMTAIHAGHDLRPEVAEQHRARRSTRGVARRTPSPTASPGGWAADRRAPVALRGGPQPAAPPVRVRGRRRRVGPRGVARAAHRGAGRALAPPARRVLRHARRLPRRPRPAGPVRRARHPLVQPPPRRCRPSAGAGRGEPGGQHRHGLARPRPVGSRRGPLHGRPRAAGGGGPSRSTSARTSASRAATCASGCTSAIRRRGCALAVELKKVFMDEWTGAPDEHHLDELTAAFEAVGAPPARRARVRGRVTSTAALRRRPRRRPRAGRPRRRLPLPARPHAGRPPRGSPPVRAGRAGPRVPLPRARGRPRGGGQAARRGPGAGRVRPDAREPPPRQAARAAAAARDARQPRLRTAPRPQHRAVRRGDRRAPRRRSGRSCARSSLRARRRVRGSTPRRCARPRRPSSTATGRSPPTSSRTSRCARAAPG